MEINNDQPLIFKTDISEICTNCAIHKALDNHAGIQSWSLDNEDADNVLRVISATLTPAMIIEMVTRLGHECLEL